MFNRTVINTGGPSVVHHHEHRAPTDDSIRLHREYVEAARREVVEAIAPSNQLVDFVAYVAPDPLSLGTRAAFAFKLNGKLIEGSLTLDDLEVCRNGGTPRAVHEALSRELAATILTKAQR